MSDDNGNYNHCNHYRKSAEQLLDFINSSPSSFHVVANAARMLEKGVYVVGFSYPVVPQNKARIRTQVSAGHSKEDLDFAVQCFAEVKKEMGL